MSEHMSKGFTLIELMVALVVAAVLLAFGVPAFQSTLASNRISSATNALVASLHQARAEAVRRNTRITLCKGETGDNDCQAAKAWHQGWILYADAKTDTGVKIDAANDEILRRGGQGIADDIRIVMPAGAGDFVSFTGDGRSKTLASVPAVRATRFRICSTSDALADGARARDVTIEASGSLYIQRPNGVDDSCPAPDAP